MNDKKLVALHAAKQVENGMVVGLGTGSTADCFIEELARRKTEDNLQITVVSSSIVSAIKAQKLGLPIVAIEQLTQLDLYVDGADEVTTDKILLKGQGADLVKEKLLAKASEQFIVLVEQSKMVSYIGENFAIPLEVKPFAWQMVKQGLEHLGGRGKLRLSANGKSLAVSSDGNLILDMAFDKKLMASKLDSLLNATPAVIEHGIFRNLATTVLVAVEGKIQSL